MKYAETNSEAFIPAVIADKLPSLPNNYNHAVTAVSLPDLSDESSNTIKAAITKLKDLLLNSIVLSEQGNWILITQIEFYYKDLAFDDVAMVNKYEKYVDQLKINMKSVKKDMARGMSCVLHTTSSRSSQLAVFTMLKAMRTEPRLPWCRCISFHGAR